MELEVTAPSKTFLLGEYLALVGGPALILNTSPRFKMIISDSYKENCKYTNISDDSPAAKYIEANSEIFNHTKIKFIDPYYGQGGLGASSAQFCMLAAVKNYLLKSEFEITRLLSDYHSVSWNGEGYPPSGTDVIAQLHGGILFFDKKLNIVKKFTWPFVDLSICLIHANNKVTTHTYLQQLSQLELSGLEELVLVGVLALEKRDKNNFCKAINEYGNLLSEKQLTCDKTLSLLNLITENKHVLAVKGCGALGADVICIILNSAFKSNFYNWAKKESLNIIGFDNYTSEGVTIRELDNKDTIDQVILVDDYDRQIGVQEKILAHKNAQLHRAFSIFIFRNKNNQIEVLLQQRAKNKYHCGGLWSNTCCSHPQPGENIMLSAHKRLQDEMGITCPLREIGVFRYKADVYNGLTEHEIDHIFIGKYDKDEINFNPEEVYQYRWVTVQELQDDINTKSYQYTPWLKEALQNVLNQNILSEFLL